MYVKNKKEFDKKITCFHVRLKTFQTFLLHRNKNKFKKVTKLNTYKFEYRKGGASGEHLLRAQRSKGTTRILDFFTVLNDSVDTCGVSNQFDADTEIPCYYAVYTKD